ncbi:hypothetical protein BKA83DRAFT_4513750 [Pisolithus microcarpus]|nr:hypothetical protein BKA83DRAFT_4513750 [Pisolithus microcarpus]
MAACTAAVPTAHLNPKSVSQVWMGLCAQTGLEGFYIAVRGTVEDLSEPKVFFTEKVEKFVRNVLGIEPHHLALRLESWVVSGIDVPVVPKHQRPLNKLVIVLPWFAKLPQAIGHSLLNLLAINIILFDLGVLNMGLQLWVLFSLTKLLNPERFGPLNRTEATLTNGIKGNSQMNYINYKKQIMEKLGVALHGWPIPGRVCNSSKVKQTKLEKLLDALKEEKCKWVRLTPQELATRIADNKARQARGEQIYQPRRCPTRRENIT